MRAVALTFVFGCLWFRPATPLTTVCDCENVVNNGLVELNPPSYCNDLTRNDTVLAEHHRYELYGKPKPTLSWKGYSCSRWVHVKTIVGSFWIGSYDTTYDKHTITTSDADCWEMINSLKCDGRDMTWNDKTLAFVGVPEGAGAWYSIKKYTLVNCVVNEISLSQDYVDGPILAPFGVIANDTTTTFAYHNHNVVVWKLPNFKDQ